MGVRRFSILLLIAITTVSVVSIGCTGIGSSASSNNSSASQTTSNPSPSPAPMAGNGAVLVWSDEFTNGLSLRSAANPSSGTWMPTDETWQSSTQGYEDFGCLTCSAADIASGVCKNAGGTFDINPFDPTTTQFNPFSVQNGYLTISAIPTPPSMYAAIQKEVTAQLASSSNPAPPVPAYVGGHLITNPEVFKGFTYGYFEFRVAFPNGGPAMFPALWFYSTPGAGHNPGKAHAEIDLLEIFGHADLFYTHVVPGTSELVGQWPAYTDGTWHTYGMDWTANHIDFYFDHQLMYSASADAVAWFQGVSLSPIMNYVADAGWMASNPNLAPTTLTPNPMLMNVDYARLYSVKPF